MGICDIENVARLAGLTVQDVIPVGISISSPKLLH